MSVWNIVLSLFQLQLNNYRSFIPLSLLKDDGLQRGLEILQLLRTFSRLLVSFFKNFQNFWKLFVFNIQHFGMHKELIASYNAENNKCLSNILGVNYINAKNFQDDTQMQLLEKSSH